MFQLFDIIYYLILMLILIMGISVIQNNPKSKNSWIFTLFILGTIGWIMSLRLGWIYTDIQSWDKVLMWMRLSYGFSILGMSFMTMFVYFFLRVTLPISKFVKIFYLLATIALFILASFTPYINELLIIKDGVYIKDGVGFLYFFYVFALLLNMLASAYLLIQKLRNTTGIDREKMVFVFFGYLAFVISAMTTNVILPLFNILILQRESQILIIAFIIPTYYAIHKFRFFNLSYISLNLIRQFIIYGLSFFGTYVIFKGLIILFSYEHTSAIALISMFTGITLIKIFSDIAPELISESFRNFKNILAKLKSGIYYCDTYKKLQKIIENSFLLQLNYTKATLYITRDRKAKIDIPVYVNDKFTDYLNEEYKDILIKDEISYKKMKRRDKNLLITGLENLDATLCIPLFSDNNLIGLFVLNRKEAKGPFSREEIYEFQKLKKDIEIGLMNVLLKMNLQEENDLMKSIIDKKTKNLRNKIKRINELLRQQSDFIAVTAHEFRTPLNIASFQVEELIDNNKKKKRLTEDLKVIDSSLSNLKSLIQKMFNVQQYDLNKVRVNKEKVDMNSYIKEIYDDFLPLMNEKNIEFTLNDKLKENTTVSMDRSQMRQVFHNILTNAHKYTPKNGKVHLSIKKQKKQILVNVADNGSGIPKASRKRIFEKFQTINVGTGIGLGLYICKKIIELHKGKIWIDDSKLGGAVFCFTLG